MELLENRYKYTNSQKLYTVYYVLYHVDIVMPLSVILKYTFSSLSLKTDLS